MLLELLKDCQNFLTNYDILRQTVRHQIRPIKYCRRKQLKMNWNEHKWIRLLKAV